MPVPLRIALGQLLASLRPVNKIIIELTLTDKTVYSTKAKHIVSAIVKANTLVIYIYIYI